MSARWLLIAHLACTWFLVGLIWTIQVVHYPLFEMADKARFAEFAAAHSARITPVVGPAMVLELLLAGWLVLASPAVLPRGWALAGLALLAIIWVSTALLQVPQHGRLADSFDEPAHAFLVTSNWVRTVAWTLRGALAAAMVARQAA
jgi:hypothetical protein